MSLNQEYATCHIPQIVSQAVVAKSQIPFQQSVKKSWSGTITFSLNQELAASHGLSYYGRTTTLAALRKYVTDTISAEFLPEDF